MRLIGLRGSGEVSQGDEEARHNTDNDDPEAFEQAVPERAQIESALRLKHNVDSGVLRSGGGISFHAVRVKNSSAVLATCRQFPWAC